MGMKSNDFSHDTKNAQTTDYNSSQTVDVTRRRFLATSAVGIVGLGAVGSAAAAPDTHTLVIDGSGPVTSYQFTVGGNLEKSTADGATINSGDEIVGRSAHGAVKDGKDAYTFTGPLYSFDFDDSNGLDVDLDGEAAHVGRRPDHTLVIEGFGEVVDYSFSTSDGRPEQSDAYGATINSGEKINDYGVEGAVYDGKDAFTYDGELLSFDFDEGGEIRVTVDGKAAHVGQLPDRTLTIVANGEYTEYEFTVENGTIREVINAEDGQDSLNGNTFSGAVSGTGYDKITYDDGIEKVTEQGGTASYYSNYSQLFR